MLTLRSWVILNTVNIKKWMHFLQSSVDSDVWVSTDDWL